MKIKTNVFSVSLFAVVLRCNFVKSEKSTKLWLLPTMVFTMTTFQIPKILQNADFSGSSKLLQMVTIHTVFKYALRWIFIVPFTRYYSQIDLQNSQPRLNHRIEMDWTIATSVPTQFTYVKWNVSFSLLHSLEANKKCKFWSNSTQAFIRNT